MDSFFSNIFPFFGKQEEVVKDMPPQQAPVAAAADAGIENSSSRKRARGSRTPTLISTKRHIPDSSEEELRPLKIFRGASRNILVTSITKEVPIASSPLEQLPEDVLAHCLSFVGGVEDRFALQCTSKQFKNISDSDDMMLQVAVGGDRTTGMNGIILETDTPVTAADKLTPFALAGNLEALYMLGILKSYCDQDVENGICLLKMASAQGYVRASYALGLVLRDSQPDVAGRYMKSAADAKYLPALQELLPAREMKAQYGEPNAEVLRNHLDHLCLNRLLSRHYCSSSELRVLNTSHCWNPLCGRWAFKATVHASQVVRRPWGFVFYRDQGKGGGCTHVPSAARVSRMKMCSRCCRAKYCSKLCQVYDWRSGRHKMECQFL